MKAFIEVMLEPPPQAVSLIGIDSIINVSIFFCLFNYLIFSIFKKQSSKEYPVKILC